MELASELRRLRGEHAELRDLSDALRSGLEEHPPENLRQLFSIRQQFQTLMVRHLKCEDWILYPRIKASPNEQLSCLADHIFSQFGDLADVLLSYADSWDEAAVRADWASYCVDTKKLLDHAERRARSEETIFFPAIASDYAIHRRLS